MKVADGSLFEAKGAEISAAPSSAVHPLLIEPWISAPADIVVYEFGARLDENCAAAAAANRQGPTPLQHSDPVHPRCPRGDERWFLERACLRAKALQDQLSTCELEIAAAKAAADAERLRRVLAAQRIALGTELTRLWRPTREKYRAEIRSLFFPRVGNTTATETYQMRCQAVTDGLGWATATAVLDSACLRGKSLSFSGGVRERRLQGSGRIDSAIYRESRTADRSDSRQGPLEASARAATGGPIELEHAQGRRAKARDVLTPQLKILMPACAGLPSLVQEDLTSIVLVPSNHVATRRIYRLQAELAELGIRRSWLDAWVREDRMRWQAAVLLARRARGRRRDFFRRAALQLAREHGALVREPLDLKAASKAFDAFAVTGIYVSLSD